MTLMTFLLGAAVVLAAAYLLSRRASFLAQRPADYATGPAFDIRERLNGPIDC